MAEYVRPVCLAGWADFVNETVVVTGWGSPSDDEQLSPVLRKVTVQVR